MARPLPPRGRFSLRTRAANVQRFQRDKFDIAIMGGGITGAGIARDAALRGLSVALLEKGDFGSGTSSKSPISATPPPRHCALACTTAPIVSVAAGR